MNTTQLSVNPANLVKNLRFSFTQATTVLGELMQNARRAGATSVSFDYDETHRQLTVTDNGCGIACLKTLLTVAESGWAADVIEKEQPFGLGFLSALFSCTELAVTSKGGQFVAATADLLAFQPVMVQPVTNWDGLTRLVLSGFKPDANQIENHLPLLAKGFAIDVKLNGKVLERPRALDAGLAFISTDIGDIAIQGCFDGERWLPATGCFHVYLQGLPVYHSTHERYAGHVVHLNPSKFHARLPDRDKLIDQADVIALVQQAIQREARRQLENLKQQLVPIAFVEGYDTLKACHCLDLLNDVPWLPKQVLAAILDYPIMEGCSTCNLETVGQAVSQIDIVSGKVKVVELDDLDFTGALPWMFAWQKGFLVYNQTLDSGHWLFNQLLNLNEVKIDLQVIGETHRAFFNGQWIYGLAVFCGSYRLSWDDDHVDIATDALYHEQQGVFIVPNNDASGAVVRQASTYQDEWDCFNESAKEADEWAFQNFVVANTAADPAQALSRLLASFNSCPALFGKRFEVVIDEMGNVAGVVEAR